MSYINESVDSIKLENQSGTVCSVECYYKVEQDGTPVRIGKTDNFPVGQSGSIDLNSLDEIKSLAATGRNIWVTAFANVKVGTDSASNVWLQFKENSKKEADYVIYGVVNFTKVAYVGTVDK